MRRPRDWIFVGTKDVSLSWYGLPSLVGARMPRSFAPKAFERGSPSGGSGGEEGTRREERLVMGSGGGGLGGGEIQGEGGSFRSAGVWTAL